MEQNIAILIGDLSGYTALTERHGAVTAANLIDKFLEIVQESLVGESKLHQRVGDEVMIISVSPDDLLRTAIRLIENCSNEQHFLQVHGGLHYGKMLKRNDHYFGSPLNLTSRIAAKANNGSFWCSVEFVDTLSDKSSFTFYSKGKHKFKNVSEENEVFELMTRHGDAFHTDPVCRMLLREKEAAIAHPHEHNIFFCCHDCLDIYVRNKVA